MGKKANIEKAAIINFFIGDFFKRLKIGYWVYWR